VFGANLSFASAVGDVDTYSTALDARWFFEQHGVETRAYPGALSATVFTIDEYRSLIQAATSTVMTDGQDAVRCALVLTLYTHLHDVPDDPGLQYFKEKIYATDVALAMLETDCSVAPLLPDGWWTRDRVLDLIRIAGRQRIKHWWFLRKAPDDLRQDRAVAVAALEQIGANAFLALDRSFRDDEELALRAVNGDCLMMRFVSDRLKDNRNFVKRAMARNPCVLRLATERMRNDPELAKEVNLAECKGDLSCHPEGR
jgi:hypothetical protein